MTDLCGQVLWYKMNETVGATAADSSGFGRNGTIGPNVDLAFASPPVGNGSFNFNWIANSYVYLPSSSGDTLGITTAFSIAVWIKDDNSAAFENPRICEKSGAMSFYTFTNVNFQPTPDILETIVWTGGHTTLIDGNWHLLVATWDETDTTEGSNGSAYIWDNTTQVAAASPSSAVSTNFSAGDLYIGSKNNTDDWWGGPMGDFMLFDRALTEAEIDQMYAAGTPCIAAPVMITYDIDADLFETEVVPDAQTANLLFPASRFHRVEWF